jgi:ribosomal protein L37AE/L43A
MARNWVQFQRGLSLVEVNARYGTEEQCHAALVAMRWTDGFVCPKCSSRAHSYYAARRLFQCTACRLQTSVRAGTIFHKSTTPLTKWFLAIHLITSSKNDIASLELSRQLDVKWDTAWLIKQKLMEVMRERNATYKLAGDVQVDDAYLGGEKAGKPGRGAANKLPFIVAVATRDGNPIYTHLRCVSDFTSKAMVDYATANIASGARVLSDGLACFGGFAEAGFKHTVSVTGGGRPKGSDFKWVNTGLGNTKGAITGTCRSCDARHAPRYLASYEYRYNRRFNLPQMVERLAAIATQTGPRPHRFIAAVRPKRAETPG